MTNEVSISLEEWIDRGYRRYDVSPTNREVNRLADFLLQKRFDDELGKKYYITVYSYDRDKYPPHAREHVKNLPRYGYMPSAHFSLRDHQPFFNIEMNGIRSIDEVESYFERFWEMLNKPYYELFETGDDFEST